MGTGEDYARDLSMRHSLSGKADIKAGINQKKEKNQFH
jgi:hypothetical protein